MVNRRSNAVDVHVGCRIRQRRTETGMSQTELGNELGLTFQQVQKYEKGSNRVGAGRLADIAKAFGVEVGYFYEGAPGSSGNVLPPAKMETARKRSEVAVSLEGAAVIESLTAMRPTLRRAMVKIARVLAGV